MPASAAEDLRDLLPAIEADRRIDDWGRSERVEGFVDRTLVEFLYHLWFRCEVDGIEHVPVDGPALLVANHSGGLLMDAWMIGKAIKEEHRRPRPLSIAAGSFAGLPGASMLLPKLGAVPAHPANLHRLLYDERRLVLGFPEGTHAPAKPFRHRYRLAAFGAGLVEAALLARAPVVPVAVVGAEEARPPLPALGPLRRLAGPLSSILPAPAYLPAKFRIRFLAPVPTDDKGPAPWRDARVVQALCEDVRGMVQQELADMLDQRQSVWLG